MTMPGFTAEASLREVDVPQASFSTRSSAVSHSAGLLSQGTGWHAIMPQQSLDGGVYSDPTLTRYCHRVCWPGGFCEIVCHSLFY
jgi:hypothetical protein